MEEKRWYRISSVFLSVIIALVCLPIYNRADNETVYFYSVNHSLQYEVNVRIVSSWGTHANVEFELKNTGNEVIHNWFLTFDFPYEIEGIWNASVVDTDDAGVYTCKNAGWNQDVVLGGSVCFGMTVASFNGKPIENLPTFFLLNTNERKIDSSVYEITCQEYSNWGTGFNGAIVISNTSNDVLEDWKMVFSSNREILEFAGVEFSADGKNYMVGNNHFVHNIDAGSSVNMTIVGNEQNCDKRLEIYDVTLYCVTCAFGLKDDYDQNGRADYIDYLESQKVQSNNTPTPTPTQNTTILPTPIPTTVSDYSLDSDEDGIPDYYESRLGTNPDSKDSDGDHIEDGIELLLNMDPLSDDSDANGICDAQEDVDQDGLSLAEEIAIGTDLFSSDTDFDDLSDYEEYFVFGTDPLKYDTDDDGIGDGDEIRMGKDPNDSSDKCTRVHQTISVSATNELDSVSVQVDLAQSIDSVLQIHDVYNIDMYTTDLVGRIGSPFSFECEDDFDKATIIFHYNESKLGDTEEENLAVLWYDESKGFYINQEQAVLDSANDTITLEVDHFSTYVLVDKLIWENIPNNVYVFPTEDLHFDYYIAIDISRKMNDSSRRNAITAITNLAKEMTDEDRICIIYVGENYLTDYMLISKTDTNAITEMLDQIEINLNDSEFVDGIYCSYRTAFIAAKDVITQSDNDVGNYKTLFVLSSDSDVALGGNYIRDMKECKEQADFTASFVMLQSFSAYQNNFGYEYAEWTESDYYAYPYFEDLQKEFVNKFALELAMKTDTDFDSVPDFLEKQGIIATNGRIYYSDPNNKDTDDDTTEDCSEIGIIYQLSRYKSRKDNTVHIEIMQNGNVVYLSERSTIEDTSQFYFLNEIMNRVELEEQIIVCVSLSNPNMPDSDLDGVLDNNDAKPNVKNGSMSYILYDDSDGADWFLKEEAYSRKRMFSNDQNLTLIPVKQTSGASLENEWNRLGEDTNGKVLYDIQSVILIFHGSPNSIGGVSSDRIKDGAIKKKTIDTLILSSCNSGRIDSEDNVARAFMNWGTINEVYAWNGTASFLAGGRKHVLLNTELRIPFTDYAFALAIPLDIVYSLEYSQDAFELFEEIITKNVVEISARLLAGDSSAWLSNGIALLLEMDELSSIGRVRYYRDSEGEVVYEKVSNNSLSVMLSLYSS